MSIPDLRFDLHLVQSDNGQELGASLTKFIHVMICGAFSLTAAYFFSPEIQTIGLCGLSGIDHGLLAITSLGMIKTKNDRYLGYACLGLVMQNVFMKWLLVMSFFRPSILDYAEHRLWPVIWAGLSGE